MPRILKRLFKFPQMDFEVAIWEMLNLMISPRKVVRNLYYQKRGFRGLLVVYEKSLTSLSRDESIRCFCRPSIPLLDVLLPASHVACMVAGVGRAFSGTCLQDGCLLRPHSLLGPFFAISLARLHCSTATLRPWRSSGQCGTQSGAAR